MQSTKCPNCSEAQFHLYASFASFEPRPLPPLAWERNVHAHLLRYGYAINFLNCGGRSEAPQEQPGQQPGHWDIKTTRRYPRLSDEDSERAAGKLQITEPCIDP